MPVIIHTDKNAQHIGFQVQAILVPAICQLVHLVSADPTVIDGQFLLCHLPEQPGGNQKSITSSE